MKNEESDYETFNHCKQNQDSAFFIMEDHLNPTVTNYYKNKDMDHLAN